MPKRKLSAIAQDVRLAREMGLTYGALKAPPVYVRGYAGELYPEICARRKAVEDTRKPALKPDKPPPEVRRCIVCNATLKGRQERFCSRDCQSSFHSRKHYEKVRQQARFCPNCGKPVSGRKTYCDAVCGNAFRQKQYFERKKAVAASQG